MKSEYLLERVIAELAPPQSKLSLDTQAADPVAWIERNFRIPETPDHLLRLGDYQKYVLRLALTPDGVTGWYPYSVVVWSDIKKSIKSTVAAAVAIWRAYATPWASIKVVANDLKQADSRVSYYIRRCIELHPVMKKEVKVKPSGYTIDFPNHSRIEAIPVDPKGEAGGNDDLIIFSELWAANNVAATRMWTEMTLSPTKFGKSFRWVETYAGHYGEAPLLEQLHHAGVHEGTRVPGYAQFDPPLEIYENQESRLLCLWNDTPRLYWQTPEYYAQEAAVLTPSEFNRVHRNQWASSEQIFIPPEWWKAAELAQLPGMGYTDPCILAVDAAVDDDSFGILVLSGTPSGRNEQNENNAEIPPPGIAGNLDAGAYTGTLADKALNASNDNNRSKTTSLSNWPYTRELNQQNPLNENNRNSGVLRSAADLNENSNLRGFSFVQIERAVGNPQNENNRLFTEIGPTGLSPTVAPDHYYVRYAHALKPGRVGSHVSFADAEAIIRALIERFNIVEMTYDPYMLEDMAQRFRNEGLVHLHAFGQASPRLLADKQLHDVIRDRRIHSTSKFELLAEHLYNANARYEADRLRIVKRNRRDKIDLAVCLSMALARAVYWRI